ncbi:TetR/AcrR family transcriptional regulator [Ferrimonas balearica]|nr:TetR/AcrR family transcriptional regulator [Ferrimonas balearica]
MNKSELFKAREQRILSAALTTARSKGALDFRMADVARAAECSVGTLYGHFLSKEDMMAALVQVSLHHRHQWIARLNELDLTPMERFVVLMVSERIRLSQDEVLAQLELLVSHTELWRRAADQRQLALKGMVDELVKALEAILQDARQQGLLALNDGESAALVARARALMLGFQLQSSRQTLAPTPELAEIPVLMEAIAGLLTSVGLSEGHPDWRNRCVRALEHWQPQPEPETLEGSAA